MKDLVTATNMIEENVERGEGEFAVKALPRRQGGVKSPGGKIFTVCNFVSLSPVSNLGGEVGQLFSALFAHHGEAWRRG